MFFFVFSFFSLAALKGPASSWALNFLLIFIICFRNSFVIVGDSNLVRLGEQIEEDIMLRSFNVKTFCKPGMRAKHLDANDLLYCSKFSHCLIMLGNNDVSQHPTKAWIKPESPIKTAARIAGFALRLKSKNVRVKVIGLLSRPDVNYNLVKETNYFLMLILGVDYVGPRKIHSSHFIRPGFPRDLAHLNYHGKKRVLSLFLRIIRSRYE